MNFIKGEEGLQFSQAEVMPLYLHGAALFQYLHAGVVLGLFEHLFRQGDSSSAELEESLGLSSTSLECLVFGLQAMKLIKRKRDRLYNAPIIERIFKVGEWQLIQSIVLFQAHIVYPGQVDFVESLKKDCNVGVRRFSGEGKTIYQKLDANEKLQGIFYQYMETYSNFALPYLLKQNLFHGANRVLDVGGGGGNNAIQIAKARSNLSVTILDLPHVKELIERQVARHALAGRVAFQACDIFKDEFPRNMDCVLFIHQLVIWSREKNSQLLAKAFRALKPGGKVIIFSSMADKDYAGPLMAALDTAYFKSLAAPNGMIYAPEEYRGLLEKNHFQRCEVIRCNSWTPHCIVVGYKSG